MSLRCVLGSAALALLSGPSAAGADEIAELERKLGASDKVERREAVVGLAELGTEAAWSLVVDALGDLEARVADEAQLRLGACASDEIARVLCGRRGVGAGTVLVPRRAAELLGRMPAAVDPDALVAATKDRDELVRRYALWSIERRALRGACELDERAATHLERLVARDDDAGVRAAALLALAAARPVRALERAQGIFDAKRPAPPEVRVAGTMLAAGLPDARARALVLRAAYDEESAVRAAAVEALAAPADRDAARRLVERLEREERARLAWRIVEHLRRWSRLAHGLDPRPWRAWADALPEGWTGDADARRAGESAGAESTTSAFVGLPLRSDSVAFVFDFSGSLWKEREGGRTRKDALDGEVRRALESLPESTRFALVPYTLVPHPWRKELAAATPATVTKALDWFEDCRMRGQGAVWEALLLALADPEVDSVVLLTDGRPSGGAHWNLELLRALLAERNRFRRVTLDVVLVDTSRGIEALWRAMAADSGGRCLTVEL